MRKLLKLSTIFVLCIVGVKASGQFAEDKCTIYKIGDNNITQEINTSDISLYINNNYEWSVEPTTLMYASDGRTTWICQSEIQKYSEAGWSTLPPVTIYSNNGERMVLQEEVEDYLATGLWFKTRDEALQINISMNIFSKTNIPPKELNKTLSKGLSGTGHLFYEMEQTYGINSIFAISVAELESGNGTSYAFRYKNNPFGIGPGKVFKSISESITYFGQLMNKNTYRNKSIEAVGSIYCPGDSWAYKIKSLMYNNYSVLGY